jgi:hypothetical protein
MAAPVLYPVVSQFNGVAKEGASTPGTPVAMTATVPCDTFKWEDKPLWGEDKAYRGVMGNDAFSETQLVYYCDVSAMGAPVYADTIGWLAGSIFGSDATTATTAPFDHVFSLLNPAVANSYQAQGTTLTWTHYTGVATGTGAIQIPYFRLSQLVLTWEFATGMLMWTAKGQGWKSVIAAARPTAAPSAQKPFAGWVGQLGVGGTVISNPVTNLEKATFTFNRELEMPYTGNGVQNPLSIGQGGFSCTFDLQFLAQDYTYYNDMMNDTEPQLQALFSVGAGASLRSVQIDMQQAAFQKSPDDKSKKFVRWMTSGKGVFNSTNVGSSGGLAPAQMTVKNAITAGTYL